MRTNLEAPARRLVRTFRGGFRSAVGRLRSDTSVGWPDERPDHIEKISTAAGIAIRRWRLSGAEFRRYLDQAHYPSSYHGGSAAPEPAFYEKALEHFVSLALIDPHRGEVLIDVASHGGPFAEIAESAFGCVTYHQDLAFPPGVNGRFIGGDAADMPVPDGFADLMTLHCSYDHFEGPSDMGFAREAGRVLRPGGRAVVVPLYLSDTFGVKTDPQLRRRSIPIDPGMRRFLIPGLRVEFSRVYDPHRLAERVLAPAREAGLVCEVVRVEGVTETVPQGYCHYALVLHRPG